MRNIAGFYLLFGFEGFDVDVVGEFMLFCKIWFCRLKLHLVQGPNISL